jgi:hypothetical protein
MRQELMSIDHTTTGAETTQRLPGDSVACSDAMKGVSAALVPSGTKRDPWAGGDLWIRLPEYSKAALQEFLRHEHGAELPEELATLFIGWCGINLCAASEDDIMALGVPRMKAFGLCARIRLAILYRTRGTPIMKRSAKWQSKPNQKDFGR